MPVCNCACLQKPLSYPSGANSTEGGFVVQTPDRQPVDLDFIA